MFRRLLKRVHQGEGAQALPLFALGIVGIVGLLGLSVDIGRLVWARTSIQGAVDAAVLAAAQDMPTGTSAAQAAAEQYWLANSGSIRSQGENVTFTTTYPPGNRAVQMTARAEVPTWFARVVGLDHWDVSASGTAASQVLDISLVLDISGSMCWGSYTPVDKGSAVGPFGPWVGPGRTADVVKLTAPIPAGGASSINISVNSTAIFNSTSSSQNNAKFGYNTSTRYYQYTPSNGRRGLIKIGSGADAEIFLITAIPSSTQLTVTRAQNDTFLNVTGAKLAHSVNDEVWSQRGSCLSSAYSAAGPYDTYDGMIADAKYFTTLFNSAYDKIGATTYSTAGTIRTNLSSDFAGVRSALDSIGYPEGGTNAAHGIAVGRQVLDGSGKRANSARVLVFLTDGRANAYCGSTYSASNYNTTSCPSQGGGTDGNSSAVNAALAEAARAAADNGTIIYTIGFGAFVDDTFLTNIANTGKGQYFKAPTLAELDDAFRSVAQATHISLTQ